MWRTFGLSIVSLGLVLSPLACSGDQSTPSGGSGRYDYHGGRDGSTSSSGDGGVSSCAFASGANGAVTVSTQGSPVVLDDAQGVAMNQLDGAFRALPDRNMGVIARGPCGTLGVLLRPSNESVTDLQYLDVTAGARAAEIITSPVSDFDASLYFDDACNPTVLRGTISAGYVQYVRSGPGLWDETAVVPDLSSVLGEVPTSLSHVWGGRGSDGGMHSIAVVRASAGERLLHGSRDATVGSSWAFNTVPAPSATELHLVRVAPNGALHALYKITEYPCDPCNLDLIHGVLPPGASTWNVDVVQPSKWGPPRDEFATDPSLAFDATGAPWIAARFEARTVTGSLISSDLRLYGTTHDGWCAETVISQPDDYEGGDGPAFTGVHPDLAIDNASRFHVVFSDEAQWHDGQGNANNIAGQLRYAVRSGTQWYHATLYAQLGQTKSPQPLHGLDGPFLVTSPDGSEAFAVGTERIWETSSIYNSDAVPLTLRALALRASITPQ